MIDTRAVAQEVQDQLMAALQKGHEQFRKGQEQVRKGRESVSVAVRTGNQLAKAVMPALPKAEVHLPSVSDLASREKLRAHAQELAELAEQAVARQRKFADNAQELAGQVLTTQRKLAGRAFEMASPLVAEGVNRLTQAAGSFGASRRAESAKPAAHAKTSPAAEDTTAVKPARAPRTASAKPATAKTGTAKTGTAKSGSAKSGSAKTAAAKTAAAKTAAAKTAAAKTKASGTARKSSTTKK